MINILRRGYIIAKFLTDGSATITKKFMSVAELSAVFRSDIYTEIKRGDYVEVEGERYYFFELPKVTQNSRKQFEYDCKLHSEEKVMENVLFLFLDMDSSNRIHQSSTNYDLTATIDEFLSLVCNNINRERKGWKYNILSGVDRKKLINISINGESVANAFKKIIEAFSIEYTIKEKTIIVGDRVENKTGLSFSYPKNLLSPVTLDMEGNEKMATKLYVFGGNRNIPKGYRDSISDRLLMTNGMQFLKRNSETIIEKVKVFDDVYPRRNSSIDDVRVSSSGYYFVKDSTIDFNLLEALKDTTAKISFNSGLLIGNTFEISSYNTESKEIEIKQQTDSGVNIPNESLCPRAGDEYVFLDIVMPSEYVEKAENELYDKAKEYFDKECVEQYSLSVKPSDIWLQRNGIRLEAGDLINVKSHEIGVDQDIRIESVTSYPFSLKTQEIELANFRKKSKLQKIIDEVTANTDNASITRRIQADNEETNSLSINTLNNRTQWKED